MNDRIWSDPVTIKPVGVVESAFKDFSQPTNYETESVIAMREDLNEGLIGLEHFSHLHVMYYQHRRTDWQQKMGLASDTRQVLTMPLSGEPTCKGIYTTRTPARPSGIGSCVVELVRREKNKLTVRGLDAFDGTAILDIKIYIARYDSIPNAISPLHWCIRQDLEESSKLLHWDTMNVGLTLGLRAGARAMKELGVSRGEALQACVHGGPFFAHGVEGTTGCGAMRGTMEYEDHARNMAEWKVVLFSGTGKVTICMQDHLYAGADEVLSLPDDVLFASVKKE